VILKLQIKNRKDSKGHFMKTIALSIYLLVIALSFLTSCKTFQGFPKGKGKSQKTDYSDPSVQLQFERGKIYRIWMEEDDKVIDLVLYEVKEDRFVGVLEKNNFRQTGYLAKIEVPFDRIKNIKVKRPFVIGTVVLVSASAVALYFAVASLFINSFVDGL
jgi:predicted small secreted protein